MRSVTENRSEGSAATVTVGAIRMRPVTENRSDGPAARVTVRAIRMRSVTENRSEGFAARARAIPRLAAPALALALAACGNYSTEDLRFLAALPTRGDLSVTVPAGDGNASAATVCPIGTADTWLWAKPTSEGLNRGVAFVVSLIDVVRRHPPSAREQDLRRWGPFPDEKHPGRELQIVLTRSFPPALGGTPQHGYVFEAREAGTPTFEPLIAGTFVGSSSSRGRGSVELYFDTFWRLGMNDPTTPRGTMRVGYDRASDPVTIELQLTNDGFDVVRFGYGFAGYRDGHGEFQYAFRNASNDLLEVSTRYVATGAGRNAVTFTASGGQTGSFQQCWGPAACLTYHQDPTSYSCGAPCELGVESLCVTGPIPPF
jgi:hypothetical protein